MTREQAVKRLQKLYNSKAYWRVGQSISSPERRQEAREKRDANKTRIKAINDEIAQRLSELPWYMALIDEKRTLMNDRAEGWMGYYKFSVGINKGLFIEITGHGDTWEQAISEAEAKQPHPRS